MRKLVLRIMAVCTCLAMLVSLVPAFAAETEDNSLAEVKTSLKEGETYKAEEIFDEETVENLAKNGFPTETELVSKWSEEEEYWELAAVQGTAALRVDQKGVLIGVTNWDNDAIHANITELSPDKAAAYEANVRALLKLGENYKLDVSRDWDDDYYEFRWLMEDENGTLSDFDSAKAHVSKIDGTVVSLGFFYTEKVEKTVNCSPHTAISNVTAYVERVFQTKANVTEVTMGYMTPDRTGEYGEERKTVRYCYCVEIENGALYAYVDTENGKVISILSFLSGENKATPIKAESVFYNNLLMNTYCGRMCV